MVPPQEPPVEDGTPLRGSSGAIPLVTSYDVHERVRNPPMPLLFQRDIGTEHRAFTPTALRKLLINAPAATGPTDTGGQPLVFSPHDFRRICVTDAIMNGLSPHIAQVPPGPQVPSSACRREGPDLRSAP